MIVYFINDTSKYHGGSFAVCTTIKKLLREGDHKIIIAEKDVDLSKVENCDIVLVNGEGTIHNNRSRAIKLLEVLKYSQNLKKKTILCNASWFNMSNDYDDVLHNLDSITVREILSAEELKKKHNVNADLSIDLSYWYDTKYDKKERTKSILVTDFYIKNEFKQLKNLKQYDLLNMRKITWEQTLSEVSSAKMLVTGRYHGVYAACKTRTPFIAFPGNTPKIEGLIKWSGVPIPMIKDLHQFNNLYYQTSIIDMSVYDKFFNWIEAQPKWKLPF